jgi:DeoR/GlpR family transcriptional regulator of sugar metabolism
MFNTERRQYILDQLTQAGRVSALELSTTLGVSEDTIRRDLREMAAEGLLQRVHGGALRRSPALGSYTEREHTLPVANTAIGRVASQLIHDGQVVILGGGTTNVQVARNLPRTLKATIVTHNLPAAVVLTDHPLVEVIVIGGSFHKHSQVTVGATAFECFQKLRADICLLGICSLHPEFGVSTTEFEEASIQRAMIMSSAEVVVLGAGEKLGTIAPHHVSSTHEVTHLVTEHTVAEATLTPFSDAGITIIRAEL